MNNNDDNENEWLGATCETAEVCLIAGYWEQVQIGRIDWHEAGDKFPELSTCPL